MPRRTSRVKSSANECADGYGFSIILANLRIHRRIGNRFSEIDKCKPVIKKVLDNLISKKVDGILYIGVHPRDVTGILETGFDNRECSFYYTPKLTTMDLPLREMGIKAMDTIYRVINRTGDDLPRTVKLKCRLVERRTPTPGPSFCHPHVARGGRPGSGRRGSENAIFLLPSHKQS